MGLVEGCLVVQIHCGSRGFGHQICTDYVQEFQRAVQALRHPPARPGAGVRAAHSPEGQDYLAAMRCAANYAFANRQVLAHYAAQGLRGGAGGRVKNWHLHQVYDISP